MLRLKYSNSECFGLEMKFAILYICFYKGAVISPPVAPRRSRLSVLWPPAKKVEESAKQADTTTQKSMPGFESIFAIAGLLSMAFAVYRRHN